MTWVVGFAAPGLLYTFSGTGSLYDGATQKAVKRHEAPLHVHFSLGFIQSIGSGLVEHMQGLSNIMTSSLWCRTSKLNLDTDLMQCFTRQRDDGNLIPALS
jgi:hypothetical protein